MAQERTPRVTARNPHMPRTASLVVALDTPVAVLSSHLSEIFYEKHLAVVGRERLAFGEFYRSIYKDPIMSPGGKEQGAKDIDKGKQLDKEIIINKPLFDIIQNFIDYYKARVSRKQAKLGVDGDPLAVSGRLRKLIKERNRLSGDYENAAGKERPGAKREFVTFQMENFGKTVPNCDCISYENSMARLDAFVNMAIRLAGAKEKSDKLPFADILAEYRKTPESLHINLALLAYPCESQIVNVFFHNFNGSAMKQGAFTVPVYGQGIALNVRPYSAEACSIKMPESTPTMVFLGSEKLLGALKTEFEDDLRHLRELLGTS